MQSVALGGVEFGHGAPPSWRRPSMRPRDVEAARAMPPAACRDVSVARSACQARAAPAAPQRRTSASRSSGMHRALVLVLAPGLARDAPHDLELVAVGIGAVERLARRRGRTRRPGRRPRTGPCAAAARSSIVGTSQARWYRPTEPRGGRGASGPTENSPRSWWLSPTGERMKTARPPNALSTTSNPKTRP